MRVAVLGAGPAGLLFSYLGKRRFPGWSFEVFEQNAADATLLECTVLAVEDEKRLASLKAWVALRPAPRRMLRQDRPSGAAARSGLAPFFGFTRL